MKILKYTMCTVLQDGDTAEELLTPVEMTWSEGDEEIAKAEAYNGEYTIFDDGEPEPVTPSKEEDAVWDELDAAYQEGVDSV